MSNDSTPRLIAKRYEVLKTLTGSMGLILLCRDIQEDRPIALKTFQPKFLSDRAARDRFLREGAIWVELGRHPHVVTAYRVERIGYGVEVYIVLEWVIQAESRRDASLRAWLVPGKSLPPEQAWSFALHICRGMRYATRKIPGLVHRDLKPENILVGRDGLAKVTDFGISKTFVGFENQDIFPEAAPSVSSAVFHQTWMTQGVAGTPPYMAPEQWLSGEKLDVRADIYAFGCIVAEMLTGNILTLNSWNEFKNAHHGGKALELIARLPNAICELLQQCLAVKREARFSDWEDLEIAVARMYKSEIGKDPPPEQRATKQTYSDRIAEGQSYMALGSSYLDIGKAKAALDYYERALSIAQSEGDRGFEADLLQRAGVLSRDYGDPRQAIALFEKALAIYREAGKQQSESAVLNSLGIAYSYVDDLQRSKDFYEQALKIARDTGDLDGEATDLSNLGMLYITQLDYDRGISHLMSSIKICESLENPGGVAKNLGGLGQAYRKKGDLKQGLTYSQQALSIFRGLGDRLSEGRELSFQGHTYLAMVDLRNAISCWMESLKISEEIGDQMMSGSNAFSLAQALRDSNMPKEALLLAQKALATYTKLGKADWARDAQSVINSIHLAMKKD